MKQVIILTRFNRLSGAALMVKASAVLSNMTDNPHFPAPHPTGVVFREQLQSYTAALEAARDGGRYLVAVKNQQKALLVSMLNQWAAYVSFASMGNETIALSSGFDIKKAPERAPLLSPPGAPKVTHGSNEGEMVCKVAAVKGAIGYLHQYSTDSSNPDGWQTVTSSRSKCLIRNLQPGTCYYIRVAVMGTRQQLVYTDVISRYAV